jgi:hypothetical protein
MKTYNIYTLVCKNKLGQWSDLQGFGCFEEDARAAVAGWQAKGLVVELRIDTYKYSKKLLPPVKSTQVAA